ncbi:hypothetical protein P8R33_05915 [Qipengyuania sp. XHP0211]|uniref:hypothetical protein n=1 Tax=Qipengyuania sp. XHP0211 TaxID=3038079 RepID=UPI00241D8E6D|nr:hypothetical protein [Qipengyuania sp. XHP0211]MDG5750630.1 hypothetical protein [Qipengyuania sp. XHP0211]
MEQTRAMLAACARNFSRLRTRMMMGELFTGTSALKSQWDLSSEQNPPTKSARLTNQTTF